MMIRVFTTVIIISKTSSERTNTQSYNSISLRFCKRSSGTISSTRTTLYLTKMMEFFNRINHTMLNIPISRYRIGSISIVFGNIIVLIVKSTLKFFTASCPNSTTNRSCPTNSLVNDIIKTKIR